MSIGGVSSLGTSLGGTDGESEMVVLSAVTYVGSGQTLVRLIPEPLLEAEALTQATLGLERESAQQVGRVKPRAVGFPSWPIINDPANAQHALNLVDDLEWARKHAGNHAKKVRDRFDFLIGELTRTAPYFVPTLLEELARIFVAVENRTVAAQYFNRARDVERTYDLPVDPERHQEAVKEFARAGIVGPKMLAKEAAEAPNRIGQTPETFDYVLRVNVDRIDAVKEFYPHVLRDLRKVGVAVGMKADDADARFFNAVVDNSALLDAPPAFWKTARTSLVKWLRENPRRAYPLVKDQPEAFSVEEWLEFLDECGAWQQLTADRDRFLTWMQRQLRLHTNQARLFSPRMLAALESLGTALSETSLVGAYSVLPLEYVDALTSAGVNWEPSTHVRDQYFVRWGDWADQEQHTRDLTGLLLNPEATQTAIRSLRTEFIGEHLDVLLEAPGAVELISRILDSIADEVTAAQGSLPELAELMEEKLSCLGDPRLVAVNPEAMRTITSYDPAAALAWTIQAGSLAEMTWPVFEESAARLQELHPEELLYCFDSHPALVVTCGSSFELIDADEVRVSSNFPAEATRNGIWQVFSLDDDVVFYYRPASDLLVYWHGSTSQPSTATDTRWTAGVSYHSFPVSGGRLTGGGLLTPHALDIYCHKGGLACSLSDDRIFRVDGAHTAQWIPEEARFGEPLDLASVLETLGLEELGVDLSAPEKVFPDIYPAFPETQDSPAGTLHGRHVRIRSRLGDLHQCVTALGVFESPLEIHQVIKRPRGGQWLIGEWGVRDAATDLCLNGHAGILETMSRYVAHHLRERDTEASARMRGCSRESADSILAALLPEPGRHVLTRSRLSGRYHRREVGHSEQPNAVNGTAAWKKTAQFLGVTDHVLVSAVVNMAADAAELDLRWKGLRNRVDASTEIVDAGNIPSPLSPEAEHLLGDLLDCFFGFKVGEVEEILREVASVVHNPGAPVDTPTKDWLPLLSIVGHERALLGRLAGPLLNPDHVCEVINVFRSLVSDGVLCSQWRSFRVPETSSGWRRGEWKDGALVIDKAQAYYPLAEIIAIGTPTSIAGCAVEDSADERITDVDFLAALDVLEERARATTALDISEGVAEMVAGTTLPEEACTYLVGGLAGMRPHDSSPYCESHRKALGLGVAAFEAAYDRVRYLKWPLLTEMMAAAVPDPVTGINRGLDTAAMAKAWRDRVGDVGNRITKQQRAALSRAVESWPPALEEEILRPLNLTDKNYYSNSRHIAPLLTLAALRRSDDPIRLFIAEQLHRLWEYAKDLCLNSDWQERLSVAELGADFAEIKDDSEVQAYRLLTEGHIDGLIEDLQRTYGTPAGHPFDPLVSGPDIVHEVMDTHDLAEASARYFLQILALATPMDASIREWNGWKKKDIDAAAAPLIERGLLTEAKRAGAGRTRFLPGAWLESSIGEKGTEFWKAPQYLLWRDKKMRPVVRSCPPLVPMPQLFADAWARYASGDVPGYEKLRTDHYRR